MRIGTIPKKSQAHGEHGIEKKTPEFPSKRTNIAMENGTFIEGLTYQNGNVMLNSGKSH